MRKLCLLITIIWLFGISLAQAQVSLTPTVNPSVFNANTEITVTYDVTGTTLAALEDAYLWTWIPGIDKDALYNLNPASSAASLTQNVKFEKSTTGGKTTFSLTFTPQSLFSAPICDMTQIGMLLKGNDWSNGQSSDFVTNMLPLEECFVVRLISPESAQPFAMLGSSVLFSASANEPASFNLSVDGSQVNSQAGIQDYTFTYNPSLGEGIYPVILQVTGTSGDTTINMQLTISDVSAELPRPAGIIPGINYHDDNTKVTLCLLAPQKQTVFVLSEINGFQLSNDYKMYRDGEYFWLELSGLTPGQEYAYQYFVEGNYAADPFADKILDPDDQGIPETIYPDLKPYPVQALRSTWYHNRVSVFQTAQSAFNWQHTAYQRPSMEDLVVYELLIRDYFDKNNRSYQTLIDTLSYLKNLGINAIELMPIMEFNGNESWGYNPNFMLAVDKSYGTREDFKAFIDAAHQMGMAVILDIVLNQQEFPNPYLVMYMENGQLKADNPMFNKEARHPFNVFVDMNHESTYTQYYVDTICHYWLNEYQVDGFRFDLSKGFTQTNYGDDVAAWSSKDDSRIALLKRMGDKIWSHSPEAWLILEHFADNEEEKILADHGFMFWGNLTHDYKEAIIGYPNNKSINWAYHGARNWQSPNLMAYMESHDEERLMVSAENNGNQGGIYNIKNFRTSLERMKLGAAFFFTVPGPKMIWQFGELGYDYSINYCLDGTINNDCRTGNKPVTWDYFSNQDRKKLHDVYAELIHLKTEWDVFENGTFVWQPAGALKWIKLTNDQESVYVVGNFGVSASSITLDFPAEGNWYDLFTGNTLVVTNTQVAFELAPGQFHVFTSRPVEDVPEGLVSWAPPVLTSLDAGQPQDWFIYPNPASQQLTISGIPGQSIQSVHLSDLSGRKTKATASFSLHSGQIDISGCIPGLYILEINSDAGKIIRKIMVQ